MTKWAYFGHHKCATNYIADIVSAICDYHNVKHAKFHNWLLFNAEHRPLAFLYSRDFFQNAQANDIEFVLYTDADPAFRKNITINRGFHVIRDPRDIIVSAYFSHLYSHSVEHFPILREHREELKNLSLDTGLLAVMDFVSPLMRDLLQWDYDDPSIYEVKLEDLIVNPEIVFVDIFRFLNLLGETEESEFIASEKKIKKIVDGFRFEKLSKGRKRGEEDLTSHYRKGISGDWHNYFKEQHILRCKELYNDLIVQLRYETTLDWTN